MQEIDKGEYEEIVLQCNTIVAYRTKCPACDMPIESQSVAAIQECPGCKYKNMPAPVPIRCPQKHRFTAHKAGGKKEENKDKYLDGYSKIKPKQLKNKNKPDEWLCPKHAEEK